MNVYNYNSFCCIQNEIKALQTKEKNEQRMRKIHSMVDVVESKILMFLSLLLQLFFVVLSTILTKMYRIIKHIAKLLPEVKRRDCFLVLTEQNNNNQNKKNISNLVYLHFHSKE